MKLRIGQQTIEGWRKDLKRAGQREIGGVLFGEHVGESDFRIVEATQQMRGGGAGAFRRKGSKARKDLKKLLARYNDPQHFNYLGEWHSHPNAPSSPSPVDQRTMYRLLAHPEMEAKFLVLLINRLDDAGDLEMSATAFLRSGQKFGCEIVMESFEKGTQ